MRANKNNLSPWKKRLNRLSDSNIIIKRRSGSLNHENIRRKIDNLLDKLFIRRAFSNSINQTNLKTILLKQGSSLGKHEGKRQITRNLLFGVLFWHGKRP